MSNFEKVLIHYTFTLDNFFKIGAGFGKNSFIDNAIRSREHATSTAIIDVPGTSVKGRIRANFEKLEHYLPANSKSIFGTEGQAGWAHFSALTPKEEAQVGITTSTAIDRFRKSAKQQSLRVEEYAQVSTNELFGEIEGFIPKTSDGIQQVYSLLLALLHTQYFGGDKSVGFGKGQITITHVSLNNESIDLSTLKQTIFEKLTT